MVKNTLFHLENQKLEEIGMVDGEKDAGKRAIPKSGRQAGIGLSGIARQYGRAGGVTGAMAGVEADAPRRLARARAALDEAVGPLSALVERLGLLEARVTALEGRGAAGSGVGVDNPGAGDYRVEGKAVAKKRRPKKRVAGGR